MRSSMGDAFWKPNIMPVLPSRLAARMSSAVPIGAIVSARSWNLASHRAMWSTVSRKPSHVAIVALMAVTPPALRLS